MTPKKTKQETRTNNLHGKTRKTKRKNFPRTHSAKRKVFPSFCTPPIATKHFPGTAPDLGTLPNDEYQDFQPEKSVHKNGKSLPAFPAKREMHLIYDSLCLCVCLTKTYWLRDCIPNQPRPFCAPMRPCQHPYPHTNRPTKDRSRATSC